MKNGWIGVDLDGTLAKRYWPEDGLYDAARIGEPVPAMVERVKRWLAEGHDVRVFTARVGPQHTDHYDLELCAISGAYIAVQNWTLDVFGVKLEVTATKDAGMIELWDDRAVRVVTNTGEPCCAGAPKAALTDDDGTAHARLVESIVFDTTMGDA